MGAYEQQGYGEWRHGSEATSGGWEQPVRVKRPGCKVLIVVLLTVSVVCHLSIVCCLVPVQLMPSVGGDGCCDVCVQVAC